MAKRKLWSTWNPTYLNHDKHESKAAAYRHVQRMTGHWQDGKLRSPVITVYVDERDGHGRQIYERIDLREIVASWQVTAEHEVK